MPAKMNSYEDAKEFLQQSSELDGRNLYAHLSNFVAKVLDEKPPSVVDVFENVSLETKQTAIISTEDIEIQQNPREIFVAQFLQQREKLYINDDDGELSDDDFETPVPNFKKLFYHLEQAGIGFGRTECINIELAMIRLWKEVRPLEQIRFWGKIKGLERNYLIAEVEFGEGEGEESEGELQDLYHYQDFGRKRILEESNKSVTIVDDIKEPTEEEIDPSPKSRWRKPDAIPSETPRTGVNRKTYFVCDDAGQPWVKLPHVTPTQIQVARRIKKFFSGRLDAPVNSYPLFPGSEANYLRAQIARISAGTHISPTGFYRFEDDDEEVEEKTGIALRTNFVADSEWQPVPARDLIEPSLANWSHHVLNILPQGRALWWNPNGDDDDDDDDEFEEVFEKPEPAVPEVGPPLLTCLDKDAKIAGQPVWKCRLSSNLIPRSACVVVESQLWLGAYAISYEETFENIYIGWGGKSSAHAPMSCSPLMDEYEEEKTIIEQDDPTVEQEIERKKMILEKQMAKREEMERDEAMTIISHTIKRLSTFCQ